MVFTLNSRLVQVACFRQSPTIHSLELSPRKRRTKLQRGYVLVAPSSAPFQEAHAQIRPLMQLNVGHPAEPSWVYSGLRASAGWSLEGIAPRQCSAMARASLIEQPALMSTLSWEIGMDLPQKQHLADDTDLWPGMPRRQQ